MEVIRNPTVSQVITALEDLIPGHIDPFMVLGAPRANGADSNYFQVLAADTDYCCEARIFDAGDFRHGRALRPDDEGGLGDKNERVRPSLTMAVSMISAFITNPAEFPELEGVVWLDVSEEFH